MRTVIKAKVFAGTRLEIEGKVLTAPSEWGFYTLYEERVNGIHMCWVWVKEC